MCPRGGLSNYSPHLGLQKQKTSCFIKSAAFLEVAGLVRLRWWLVRWFVRGSCLARRLMRVRLWLARLLVRWCCECRGWRGRCRCVGLRGGCLSAVGASTRCGPPRLWPPRWGQPRWGASTPRWGPPHCGGGLHAAVGTSCMRGPHRAPRCGRLSLGGLLTVMASMPRWGPPRREPPHNRGLPTSPTSTDPTSVPR